MLNGCEAEALQPGQEVVIVGFGSTFAVTDEFGEIVEIEGVGTKRFTTQRGSCTTGTSTRRPSSVRHVASPLRYCRSSRMKSSTA